MNVLYGGSTKVMAAAFMMQKPKEVQQSEWPDAISVDVVSPAVMSRSCS